MSFSDHTKQLEMLYGSSINTVVEDSLYLSDMTAATNADILGKFNITHIVNASNGKVPNAFPEKYKYLNINVEDDNVEDITPHFQKVVDFLSSTNDAKRVLFHCRLGVSRSATLLIAYMMHQFAMTLREAYDLVKSRRAKVQPSEAFTDALLKYETEVFPERESEISFKYITGYSTRGSSMHSKASLMGKESISEGTETCGETEDEKEEKESACCSCCSIS